MTIKGEALCIQDAGFEGLDCSIVDINGGIASVCVVPFDYRPAAAPTAVHPLLRDRESKWRTYYRLDLASGLDAC